MWMKFPAHIIIYDSYVLNALQKRKKSGLEPAMKPGNYDAYCRGWFEWFESGAEDCINNTCTSCNVPGAPITDCLVLSEAWFCRRVFDRYLWHQGMPRKS